MSTMRSNDRGRRSCRISAFIDREVGERLYALATDRGCSITGIIEAALTEYLAARPEGTTLSLAPRIARAPGRPSQLQIDAQVVREERLRKHTGRPLKTRSAA